MKHLPSVLFINENVFIFQPHIVAIRSFISDEKFNKFLHVSWYALNLQWLPSLRHITDICLQLVSLLFRIPRICCSSAVVSFSLSYVSQSSYLLERLAITHKYVEKSQLLFLNKYLRTVLLSGCSLSFMIFIFFLWHSLPSGTPSSRPSNTGLDVCPYVCTYVRSSTKRFSNSNEIWYVGRGQWVKHGGMPCGPIQGQGHVALKVRNSFIFKIYLRHFQWELALAADWLSRGQYLNSFWSDFWCVLVFMSHDFELGRTWLAGGVDRQSRTGLILIK